MATDEVVDSVFQSITSGIPATGSSERAAVNLAYSDVLRFITYAAVATSALVLVLAVLVPDKELPDSIDPFAHTEESQVATKVVEDNDDRQV
jgi:energy-converting hydrogenase Eha subunit E